MTDLTNDDSVNYGSHMVEVVKSGTFDRWISKLKDRAGRTQVLNRIDRLAAGNPGDVRPVGAGVSELRIHIGPGYRVYYTTKGQIVILLLAGGDKSSQAVDIETAKAIAREWG